MTRRNVGMTSRIEKETQVTLTVMAMFGAFLAFWTPYAICCILRVAFKESSHILVETWAALAAKAAPAVNPFIFIMMNKKV